MDMPALVRKARYGHKQIVFWYAPDGSLNWAHYSRENIKKAILTVGAKGRFYWLDGAGCRHVAMSLRMMIHIWRCAPRF